MSVKKMSAGKMSLYPYEEFQKRCKKVKTLFCQSPHLDFVAIFLAALAPGQLAEGSIPGDDELVGWSFHGDDQGDVLIQLEKRNSI